MSSTDEVKVIYLMCSTEKFKVVYLVSSTDEVKVVYLVNSTGEVKVVYLVSPTDEVKVVPVEELADDVCAEGEGHSAVVLPPPLHVLVRVRPQQVTQQACSSILGQERAGQ